MPTPYKPAGKDPFNHGGRQRPHRPCPIASPLERTRSLGGWALRFRPSRPPNHFFELRAELGWITDHLDDENLGCHLQAVG
jgi:hypothetical protein